MESWIIPLLGGLGIGSAITAIVTKILDQLIARKNAKQALKYKEKREVYLGLLDDLHKAVVDPSDANSKAFAVWQFKVDLYGTKEVSEAIQGFMDTQPNSSERNIHFENLRKYMREDLNNNM